MAEIRRIVGAVFLSVACSWAQGPSPAAALPRQPSENRSLSERFADPPPSARILRILHKQADQPEAQNKALQQLASQGFGGFVCNVAFDGYVDDEAKWPAFLRGVHMAHDSGMALWLYDECGYPSGSARDLTLQGHPEWAARGLLIAETNTSGGDVSLALPPGKLVRAVALPRRNGAVALGEAKDLAAGVKDGKLEWQAPAGDWYVAVMTDDLIYEGTHAAVSLAFKKPYINLLMEEPTARFLQVTHDRYAQRLGNNLGEYFESTFTDEPSLMSLWMRPMPYRVLPWSETLAEEFHKRSGDDLLPLLPALVTEAGPRGTKARYDFWNTVADLVSENYFGQIQTWCRRHKLASGGHLLMEESLVGHVPLYGDFFRCARRLDAPSIDCLTSLPPDVPWYIARMMGSVADLEKRRLVMCEVSDHSQRYRPKGDARPIRIVTEDEIRGTCNRLIWGGINTLTSYYAFKDLTDDQLRRLNLHIGRCQTMLAGGHLVDDVAVLYPVESVWPKFVPAFHGPTSEAAARQIETVYRGVISALYGANREFSFVDSRALCDARVKGDTLRHGELKWRVLVLPDVDTLPREAWEAVERFWRRGGAVIAVGARPANSESEFPSAHVQDIAREVFGTSEAPCTCSNKAGGVGALLPVGMAALVPRLVDSLLERDAFVDDARSPVKVTHRLVDGNDVYFAINDSATAWSGDLHFCGRGVSEQWDPNTGAMARVADGTRVPLQLGPYGAMLFRTGTADSPKRLAGGSAAGLALTCEPLPPPTSERPKIGQGQFVRSDLSGDSASGWTASAALTKGQTDTFLFMGFDYGRPLPLGESLGLAIETAVPEGQRMSAELLVFACTQDGTEYLASTGRFLNAPGWGRAYAPFCQFHPFGGKKTAGEQKPLDPAKITSIRVGWGGYFGTEGEKVVLTVRLPQRLTCGGK